MAPASEPRSRTVPSPLAEELSFHVAYMLLRRGPVLNRPLGDVGRGAHALRTPLTSYDFFRDKTRAIVDALAAVERVSQKDRLRRRTPSKRTPVLVPASAGAAANDARVRQLETSNRRVTEDVLCEEVVG